VPVEAEGWWDGTGVCDEADEAVAPVELELEEREDDTLVDDVDEEGVAAELELELELNAAADSAALLIDTKPPLGPTTATVVASPRSKSRLLVPQLAFPDLSSL
jgi:hypothetical protein